VLAFSLSHPILFDNQRVSFRVCHGPSSAEATHSEDSSRISRLRLIETENAPSRSVRSTTLS
jgi:hypothetical protein